MTATEEWEHHVDAFSSEEPVVIDIGLDLTRAITLTATASAAIAPWKKVPDGAYTYVYDLGLTFEDTITGADWHTFAQMKLGHPDNSSVIRLSMPLGKRARITVQPSLRGYSFIRSSYFPMNETEREIYESRYQAGLDLRLPSELRVNILLRQL